ncbi:energy transducer TonB [Desulfatibacillum aliphaticivorans]|uniref:energy transducer TonB n=1 Tax=Desulfatibacillum aliphaticivorans TaxID=218208 RepID=UPI00041E6431|nr:energy transducer TonB [Desulfatibacillum aliphaticivorans]
MIFNKKLFIMFLMSAMALTAFAGCVEKEPQPPHKKLRDLSELTPQERLRIEYIEEVGKTIQKNWAMPERFVGKKMEARIAFTVNPDGRLTNLWFEKRSDSRKFDDSAEKAVKKSSPVSPFPEDLEKKPIEMAVTFTPPKK